MIFTSLEKSFYKTLLLSIFLINTTYSQNVVINEIMSSNYSNIQDEYGETPDWIELYNNTSNPIDLTNFYLSDNKNKLNKWQFGKAIIPPNEFLLVFASKKNKTSWASNWLTTINEGDNWSYKVWGYEPPSDWKDTNYDDSDWEQGASGIGYGDDDDQTEISSDVISVYLRKEFTIDNLNDVSMLLLHMDYDDGFVAYINGKEFARANIGSDDEFVPYDGLADKPVEALIYQGKKPNKFLAHNVNDLLVEGTNILAIQVHNASEGSSDLSAIPILTIGYTNHGATNVAELIENNLENLHANFKISSSGETIYLSDSQLVQVDKFNVIKLDSDISFGRKPDGANDYFMFSEPTPNKPNTTDGFKQQLKEPVFSVQDYIFNSDQNFTFINETSSSEIHFTTNGEEPTINSNFYSGAINISSTTVVKAKSFDDNYLPSKTVTHTFLINENNTLPVVSLSTEPYNFFDADSGIYVLGRDTTLEYPYWDANFWKDWERPVHVEFIDENGGLQVSKDVGAKIYGNWSRANEQKSLTLHARKRYSTNDFNYNFFPKNDLFEYESLVLRNSGNDWSKTMFRDGMMQSLANDIGVDRLAFRPSILYINGAYWGIHNLREKINPAYIATHYGIKKSEVEIIEATSDEAADENVTYRIFNEFMEEHDFTDDANYDSAKSLIDIDNFINYNLLEIYIANTDWPSNNVKFWKPKTDNGKFRWILYDTDYGFNFSGGNSFDHNTLEFALETDGPDWPNPSWATLYLRRLMDNENFKNSFINRFADFSNTIFSEETVKNKIKKFKNKIEPEIEKHIERWNVFTYNKWLNNIKVLNQFADKRLEYLRSYFESRFNLEGSKSISINNNMQECGKVKLNSIKLQNFPWEGKYFIGVPIKLQAIPNPGYRFVKWLGDIGSTDATLEFDVENINSVTAVFEKIEDFTSVVINEINYQSHSDFDSGDWIELFNNSEKDINISNWTLQNSTGEEIIKIKEGITLKKKGYFVICESTDVFTNIYPDISNVSGNFNFELKNIGELIVLYNSSNALVDSVRYDNAEPWSNFAAGKGKTLELKNPNLDNSTSSSWLVSSTTGTPGKQNDSYIVSVEAKKEYLPTQFKLSQNYPNPFNPTTTINYSIPPVVDANFAFTTNVGSENIQSVLLKVYDILGREVTTLVNKQQNPGSYNVNFDASNLASGVYYYQLRAGDFITTKKMILLK